MTTQTKKHVIQKTLYGGFVLPVTYGMLSAAALFHSKLRETFRGHRNVRRRWQKAAGQFEHMPVWFHVASVGEFEQAKPVIDDLAAHYPDVPVVVSFSSPSGYRYASSKESVRNSSNIRFIDYLPVDFTSNVRFCLDAISPRLLVFVKFDLWPNLVWEAASRGVPSLLIDATLSPTSYRFSAIGRRFYRAVYRDLNEILAISDKDASRFHRCAPDHKGICVIGDTRFDRVMERKKSANGRFGDIDRKNRFVILAGSTWPKDEVHLLAALARLGRDRKDLFIIIAPHEPKPARVSELLAWARCEGIEATTLSACSELPPSNGSPQALIIDSVGVLAEAYETADVAYVGGSFSTGVHSVIEPAIMGIPVLFGPVHHNSFEAQELLERGAAITVRGQDELFDALQQLVSDDARRRSMGSLAKSFVESQLGATKRCMERIRQYL